MNFQVFLDIAVVGLRMLLPIYAVVIVYQCFASMRRHRRPKKPLIAIEEKETGMLTPILFWENSIGRSRGSDITIADPTVSRDHCVLLRRQEGWFVSDIGSKSGTYVNGEPISERTYVRLGDEITVGETTFILRRGDEYQDEMRSSWFFSKGSDKGSLLPYKLMLLVTFFHLFMAVEASFSNEVQNFVPFIIFGMMEAVMWLFFLLSSTAFNRVNFEIETLAIMLSGMGIMLLVRQELRSAIVQLISMMIGMILFVVLVKILENPDRVYKWRYAVMGASALLLIVNLGVMLLVPSMTVYGAGNWLRIGPISFQPSEFVKVAFIFVGSAALDKLQQKSNLFVFVGFAGFCVIALVLMKDLGAGLIFFITFLIFASMRTGDFKTIFFVVAAAIGAALLAVAGLFLLIKIKPDYAYILDRFAGWGHVWEHAQDLTYQQARVLTYVASGGLAGVGVGNGYLKYIFASETDLVFGIVAEEMGIIIALTVAVAIVGLAFYSRAIATRSRSSFYAVSACGAAGMLAFQTALNIFGSTDILPLTGVTLPFISAGGSSMVACWGLIAYIKAADERTYAAKRFLRHDHTLGGEAA